MNIEDYRFGRIVINGQIYNSDLILLPDRLSTNWRRQSGHELHVEDIKEVLAANPELLIVGTGYYGALKILSDTQQYLA
ncbi:MAG: MTH938/NDUFAF3 family protein, partial [Promethearchaeota archaeon]